MRASEELLAIRERVSGPDGLRYGVIIDCSRGAYLAIRHQTGIPVWFWIKAHTHLEVVEMIERAAVAAMKAGE